MKWVGVVVLVVLAAFFGLLALGNALMREKALEIWAHGKVAEGTLTAHHGRKKSTLREYSYTYVVDGKELTAERRTIPWAARELPVGSRLVVRYDPFDPSKSFTEAEMQEWNHAGNRAFLAVIALVLLGGAAYVAVRKRAT